MVLLLSDALFPPTRVRMCRSRLSTLLSKRKRRTASLCRWIPDAQTSMPRFVSRNSWRRIIYGGYVHVKSLVEWTFQILHALHCFCLASLGVVSLISLPISCLLQMKHALGVSAPILQNVIFCHQEESNWSVGSRFCSNSVRCFFPPWLLLPLLSPTSSLRSLIPPSPTSSFLHPLLPHPPPSARSYSSSSSSYSSSSST